MLIIYYFNLNGEFIIQQKLNWLVKFTQNADVIFLQGIYRDSLPLLTKLLREKNYNYVFNIVGKQTTDLIASKSKIIDNKFSRFSTSSEGNGLLWAKLANGYNLALVQTDATPKNAAQLKCACDFLNNKEPIIFATNTFATIDGKWLDAWESNGKNPLEEYTVDHKRNKLVYGNVQSRTDRVYYKGKIRTMAFNLITEKIAGKDIFEHFGMQIIFN